MSNLKAKPGMALWQWDEAVANPCTLQVKASFKLELAKASASKPTQCTSSLEQPVPSYLRHKFSQGTRSYFLA
ncbi:hypothetical protein SLEP1_g47225 [Rubroshorea leprosula]|uniref:Uncharacterized protein n=1 Tax=Rubroshorea leprosula TaxID=152421 RepID=A0AAV5LQM2_9ROSI|nr:hypothetical protein SLEP1_g47225 [Rubroshorea leprosula]